MPNEYLTSKQAAERIGRSVSTFHYYVDQERIAPVLKGEGLRGQMFFSPTDVDRLAAELAA